jgi:hypothetical protein
MKAAPTIFNPDCDTKWLTTKAMATFQPLMGDYTSTRITKRHPYIYLFYTRPSQLTWTTLASMLSPINDRLVWFCFDFETQTIIIALIANDSLRNEFTNQRLLIERFTTERVGCSPFREDQWQSWDNANITLSPTLSQELELFFQQVNMAFYDQIDMESLQVATNDNPHIWLRFSVSGCLSMMDIFVLVSMFPFQLLPPIIDCSSCKVTLEWLPIDRRRLIWRPSTLKTIAPGLSQCLDVSFRSKDIHLSKQIEYKEKTTTVDE